MSAQGMTPNVAASLAQLSPAKLYQLQLQLPDLLSDAEKLLPEDKRNEVFREKMIKLMTNQARHQQSHQQQQQQQQQQQSQIGTSLQQGMQPMGGNVIGIQQGMQQAFQKPQQIQSASQNQSAYQDQLRMQLQHQQQNHVASMLEKTQRLQQQAAQQQQQVHQPTPKLQPMTPMAQGNIASPVMNGSPQVRQSPSTVPGRSTPFNIQGIKTLIDNFPKLLELKRMGKLKPEQERLFDSFINSPDGQNHLRQFQAHQAQALVERGLANPVSMPPGTQPQHPSGMNNMQLPLAAQQQMAAIQQQQQQMQQHQQFSTPHNQHVLSAQLQQQFPQVAQQHNQGSPIQQPQLSQQQIQQIQLQRLATAQAQAQAANRNAMQQSRPPNQANQSMINQAAAIARAAQAQQQNGMMLSPHIHAGQASQQPTPNYGSPRPRSQYNLQQMMMNIAPSLQRVAPDKIDGVKAMLVRLANMSDDDREAAFRQSPHWVPLWAKAIQPPAQQQQQLVQQAQAQHAIQAQAAVVAQAQAQAQAHVQAQAQAAAQAQAQAQVQLNMANGMGSPHVGILGNHTGTPGIQPPRAGGTPSQQFTVPLPNGVQNLHIPPGKQRNLQNQGVLAGSPQTRPPMPQLSQQGSNEHLTHQQQSNATSTDPVALQRMIEQGIPVQQAAQVIARQQQIAAAASAAMGAGFTFPPGLIPSGLSPGMVQPQQQHRNITPAMLLAQHSRENTPRPTRGPPELILPDAAPPSDKTGSNLGRASYEATAEEDARIESLFRPQPASSTGTRNVGRGTLGWHKVDRGMVDDWPEGLREVVDEEAEDDEDEEIGKVSGMPGQKKRKIQELAEEVDKALVIPKDPETLLLEVFDEHCDVISESSCMLAKHRKGTTVDRKDIQLSWEMLYGRIIPGFSADRLRVDQTRSAARHRHPNSTYAAKLKAVNDAKALWRKEKKKETVATGSLALNEVAL